MTYELAKTLKDAGFPQKFVDGRKAIVNKENTEYCFEPTLSELIEACGDVTLIKQGVNCMATNVVYNCFGSTLKEAVAKLWLALNKK